MIITETGVASLAGLIRRLVNNLPISSLAQSIGPSGKHVGWSSMNRSRQPQQHDARSNPNSTGSIDPEVGNIPVQLQRARVIALRGFSEARSGDFESARVTFARAARLDVSLDLRTIPSFWLLPRQAHEAAAAALYDVHRNRDAAALLADINTRFRPRALSIRSH